MLDKIKGKVVEECAMKFKCPVVVLDGTLPLAENLEKMKSNLGKLSDTCV